MHASLALIKLATVSFWGGPAETIVHLIRHLISFWGGTAE